MRDIAASSKHARLPDIAPQPRHAHCHAQFPRLCLLLSSNGERALEILLRCRHFQFERRERDFAGNAMDQLGIRWLFENPDVLFELVLLPDQIVVRLRAIHLVRRSVVDNHFLIRPRIEQASVNGHA
jgi:hypothetical protein